VKRVVADEGAPENARRGLLVALTAAAVAVVMSMSRDAPITTEVRFNVLFPRDVAADFAQLGDVGDAAEEKSLEFLPLRSARCQDQTHSPP
jgi:hypothetical protein